MEPKPAEERQFTGVSRITDLVSVQKGSVVSRMILNKPEGTVTVFAFDAGEGLSEHTAPYDAMIVALEGEFEAVVGGTSHRLSGGDMLIMPAHTPHAINPVKNSKMLLVMIHAP